MINLKINGIAVEIEEGATVLEAARKAGIEVPTLCYMKEINEKKEQMILPAKNLKIMLIGVVVIVVGFLLMTGGGSSDPNVFNDDMFSFRRITLAPIVVLVGFGVIAFSIMKKFKK